MFEGFYDESELNLLSSMIAIVDELDLVSTKEVSDLLFKAVDSLETCKTVDESEAVMIQILNYLDDKQKEELFQYLNSAGDTILMASCEKGSSKFTGALLEFENHPYRINYQSYGCLHLACFSGLSVKIMKRLVQIFPGHINDSDSQGVCVLHQACANADVDLIETLLNAGADIYSVDHSGCRPLDYLPQYVTHEGIRTRLVGEHGNNFASNPSVFAMAPQFNQWERFIDQETGFPYLYNESTGESKWIEQSAFSFETSFPYTVKTSPVTKPMMALPTQNSFLNPNLANNHSNNSIVTDEGDVSALLPPPGLSKDSTAFSSTIGSELPPLVEDELDDLPPPGLSSNSFNSTLNGTTNSSIGATAVNATVSSPPIEAALNSLIEEASALTITTEEDHNNDDDDNDDNIPPPGLTSPMKHQQPVVTAPSVPVTDVPNPNNNENSSKNKNNVKLDMNIIIDENEDDLSLLPPPGITPVVVKKPINVVEPNESEKNNNNNNNNKDNNNKDNDNSTDDDEDNNNNNIKKNKKSLISKKKRRRKRNRRKHSDSEYDSSSEEDEQSESETESSEGESESEGESNKKTKKKSRKNKRKRNLSIAIDENSVFADLFAKAKSGDALAKVALGAVLQEMSAGVENSGDGIDGTDGPIISTPAPPPAVEMALIPSMASPKKTPAPKKPPPAPHRGALLLARWRRVAWREGVRRVQLRKLRLQRQVLLHRQREASEKAKSEQTKIESQLENSNKVSSQLQDKLNEMKQNEGENKAQLENLHKALKEQETMSQTIERRLEESKRNFEKEKKKAEEDVKKARLFLQKHEEVSTKATTLEKSLEQIRKENEWLRDNFLKEQEMRRKYFNQVEDMKGKIRVYCRVRPLSKTEIKRGSEPCVKVTTNTISIKDDSHAKQNFSFDRIFPEDATQEQVFGDTKMLIQSTLDGYCVCLFAYGQTGSGKTFTMAGVPKDEKLQGITPRAAVELFDVMEKTKQNFEYESSVFIVELYRGKLRDLLAPPKKEQSLKIKMDERTKRMFVEGATVLPINDSDALLAAIDKAGKQRKVASTKMNADSSRSHLLVQVMTTTRNKETGVERFGKLVLVDLAGSERVGKTGATGETFKEGQAINASLSALGDVIGALTTNSKHIPYRNHPLTMLMQDSLGGSAKTLMFVNVSPADYNYSETKSSLQYASRVKKVTAKGKQDGDDKEVVRLRKQLNELKAKLSRK